MLFHWKSRESDSLLYKYSKLELYAREIIRNLGYHKSELFPELQAHMAPGHVALAQVNFEGAEGNKRTNAVWLNYREPFQLHSLHKT